MVNFFGRPFLFPFHSFPLLNAIVINSLTILKFKKQKLSFRLRGLRVSFGGEIREQITFQNFCITNFFHLLNLK